MFRVKKAVLWLKTNSKPFLGLTIIKLILNKYINLLKQWYLHFTTCKFVGYYRNNDQCPYLFCQNKESKNHLKLSQKIPNYFKYLWDLVIITSFPHLKLKKKIYIYNRFFFVHQHSVVPSLLTTLMCLNIGHLKPLNFHWEQMEISWLSTLGCKDYKLWLGLMDDTEINILLNSMLVISRQ